MGISSLLQQLKPCFEEKHVSNFRGKTVAIDGFTWLYRGAFTCAEQVALEQPCSGYIDYVMHRVRMLQHYGVTPLMVLDGRRTPMKEETEVGRRGERKKNLERALGFKQRAQELSGEEREQALQSADDFLRRSIRVTKQMAVNTMAALRRAGVACMVAPYEADAQVAYLCAVGKASAIITEDSDILVYLAAAKLPAPVLYKMDACGSCQELRLDPARLSSLPGQVGKLARGLRHCAGEGGGRLFVQLCVMSGCDYMDAIKGFGLLSVLDIIVRFRGTDPDKRFGRVCLMMSKKGKLIPEGYRERASKAEASFFYHRVYDPTAKKCVHFCSAVPELSDKQEVPDLQSFGSAHGFLGEHIEDDLMVKIARGWVDPVSGEKVTADQPLPQQQRRGGTGASAKGSSSSGSGGGASGASGLWQRAATSTPTTASALQPLVTAASARAVTAFLAAPGTCPPVRSRSALVPVTAPATAPAGGPTRAERPWDPPVPPQRAHPGHGQGSSGLGQRARGRGAGPGRGEGAATRGPGLREMFAAAAAREEQAGKENVGARPAGGARLAKLDLSVDDVVQAWRAPATSIVASTVTATATAATDHAQPGPGGPTFAAAGAAAEPPAARPPPPLNPFAKNGPGPRPAPGTAPRVAPASTPGPSSAATDSGTDSSRACASGQQQHHHHHHHHLDSEGGHGLSACGKAAAPDPVDAWARLSHLGVSVDSDRLDPMSPQAQPQLTDRPGGGGAGPPRGVSGCSGPGPHLRVGDDLHPEGPGRMGEDDKDGSAGGGGPGGGGNDGDGDCSDGGNSDVEVVDPAEFSAVLGPAVRRGLGPQQRADWDVVRPLPQFPRVGPGPSLLATKRQLPGSGTLGSRAAGRSASGGGKRQKGRGKQSRKSAAGGGVTLHAFFPKAAT